MTGEQLASVFAATGPVLLDFDGPVCNLYAGDLNAHASQNLFNRLRNAGVDVPEALESERDPLAVLRFAGGLGRPDLAAEMDQALSAIERKAVSSAPVTDGSEDFLRACTETGRPVIVVSNNAAEAIHAYLALHDISGLVKATIGRRHGRPEFMKPHQWPVNIALSILLKPPDECVLIGDSATDIEVSHKIGMRCIAYVKASDRWGRLAGARPDAMTESMARLAEEARRCHGQGSVWRSNG